MNVATRYQFACSRNIFPFHQQNFIFWLVSKCPKETPYFPANSCSLSGVIICYATLEFHILIWYVDIHRILFRIVFV